MLYSKNATRKPNSVLEETIHLDHIQPKNGNLSNVFGKQKINLISNLQLLSYWINTKCNNQSISKKIRIMEEDGNEVPQLKDLGDEIIDNWKEVEKFNFNAEEQKIKKFWELRERAIEERLTEKQSDLTIILKDHKTSLFPEETKPKHSHKEKEQEKIEKPSSQTQKTVCSQIPADLDWQNEKIFLHSLQNNFDKSTELEKRNKKIIFKDKSNQFFIFEKTIAQQIHFKKEIIKFLSVEKIKNVWIFVFHPTEKEFFYSSKKIEFLWERSTQTENPFIVLTINAHFTKVRKNYFKMYQKWGELTENTINSQKKDSILLTKKVAAWLEEKFKWTKQTDISNIFQNSNNTFVIFKWPTFTSYKKDKTSRNFYVSITMKMIDWLIKHNLKEVQIFTFDQYKDKFLCSQQTTKYLLENVYEETNSCQTLFTSKFTSTDEECIKLNQKWQETNKKL